ncbi:MAG: hypothetical protein QM737_04625 [Ferruginibacter sp.]
MRKILLEISGFFRTLSLMIKDTNTTDPPFVIKQSPANATKTASTTGTSTEKNDAVVKDTAAN